MNSKEHQKISQLTKDIQNKGKQLKKEFQIKKNELHRKQIKTRATTMDIFKYSFGQALARIALLPFDVLKCKHQASPNYYSRLVKGLSTMSKDGQLMLGLSPSFLKYFMFSFLSGQEVRDGFLPAKAYVILSPVIISSLLFPLESIKLRMQLAEPGGDFPRSFLKATERINSQQSYMKYYKGYSRFFKGFRLMFVRDLIYYSTVSTTFFYSLNFTQSMMAIAAAIVLSHPFDTLLTNVYYKKTESHPIVVLGEIYRELGVKGLYRGLLERFIFLGGGLFTGLASMYCIMRLQSL